VRLRAAAGRAALLAAGVSLAVGTAECAVRIAGLAPERYHRPAHLENPEKTAGIDAYPTNPRGYFDLHLSDAATRARLGALGIAGVDGIARRAPHAVEQRYNAHRCRDRDPGVALPGVPRVLVLGDSFTEGQGVREEDAFPRQLERLLLARGRPVEVLNCGRRGRDFPVLYTAFGELTAAYAPDVVLYAMVLNDPVQSEELRSRQAFLNDWILDRRSWLPDDEPGEASGLRLWALARDRVEGVRVAAATTRWYEEMYGPENQAGWAETRGYLASMRDGMTARGGQLVVALLPLLVSNRGAYLFAGPAAEVGRACAEAKIRFADLADSVRGVAPEALWVHAVDMHPNARAHGLFAASLVSLVEAALPPPSRGND
jgi:hypothetical protein